MKPNYLYPIGLVATFLAVSTADANAGQRVEAQAANQTDRFQNPALADNAGLQHTTQSGDGMSGHGSVTPTDGGSMRFRSLSLPLHFETNNGQADPAVRFLSCGIGYALFLTPEEAVLSLSARPVPQTSRPAVLRMRLLDANPAPRMTGLAELSGKVNYFKGNDPAQWRTNIAAFGQVKCEQVYPGIDLVFYGNSQQELEYDFVVAPGADLTRIRLGFTGADEIKPAENGDLVVRIGGQQIRQHKPRVYQLVNGQPREIAGSYVLREAFGVRRQAERDAALDYEVAFQVAAYDSAQPLVIDPVLTYSTYLGGSGSDVGTGIAVDTNGYAYVVGWTDSPNFPTTNAIVSALGGAGDRDAFVVKLKPDGSGFVYATYLGGSSGDDGNGIAVDADGNAYVTGDTGNSTDFPTVNAFQSASTGYDAFLAKLSSDGSSLLYSTKLGGAAGSQQGRAIAVGTNGDVWITGSTSSANFPTRNALQAGYHGAGDVFVARFNTTLSGDASLIYSTFLGGGGEDAAKGIAVDAAGNAYVTGYTASTNFPTTVGAFQPAYAGGDYDAFVAKLNPTGTALVYSTYLGGSGRDNDANGGGGIAVDSQGNAYVTGQTGSSDFPTKNAWQPTFASRWQPNLVGYGFVSKLNPDGSDLVYSTFLWGTGYTDGIAVDQADCAHVAGLAFNGFPTVNSVQTNHAGGSWDGFLLKLDTDGQSALYATYLGGTSDDGCTGIAVDRNGSAYVTGWTTSTNFPTQNALQLEFGGGSQDGFVAKISNPDTNPPVILAASNYGDSNVLTVDFSEALDVNSATNSGNYMLNHGVTVSSATMGINSKTVRLMTSGLTNGVAYTLTVNAVLDRAPVPNPIAPDTHVTFTALGLYRGFLHQQVYRDAPGFYSLADLTNSAKFPDHPDTTNDLHQFEALSFAVLGGGDRVSGYLLPPVTGDYTFYLSTRGQGVLFLSKNESPQNKIQISLVPDGGATSGGGRQWNHNTAGFPTNAPPSISLPVHLEAGKAYFVEALVGSYNGDILGVAWKLPGGTAPLDKDPPIAGNYLAVLGNPQDATVNIVQQPQDAALAEGQTASFSVKATASPPDIFYQWRRNGLEIHGANAPSYITAENTVAENGDLYDCVLTIPGATVTTRSALLTVTNDVTPPTLVSAEGNLTMTNITLTFSEPINFDDATNISNYVLSGGLAVSNAILLVDRKTVLLTTSPQIPGSNYTAQVSGIRDRSNAGNAVTNGTQATFYGWESEEFIGPFPSWANVKTDYGAVGDGVADDTAALQQALDEVATPGHAAVLYFPAGTYRITQTLNFISRLSATLAGEDPVTTIIKWDGPTNADMMLADSAAYSRWTRLTWDGSGNAGVAVHHTQIGGIYQVTGNTHTDEIFENVGTGLVADPGPGGDSHLIVRCHFLRCFNGIAVGSYNAIDWHVWDSVFEDCQYGMHSYAGNFHVYRSLFLRSTVADIHCDDIYYGIRGNTSIGSKIFVEGGAPMTIQGNTVVDTLDPISISGTGPMILLDNTIVSRSDVTNGPAVDVEANLLSVGNTFTVERPVTVAGRSIQMDDQVVSRDSLALPPPMIPPFLPKANRPIIEVASGADATAIQQAIDTAVGMNGQRPVVHLPTGNFLVDHTLIIPPNCDLQLVGDGYGSGALGRGTQLQWIGSPGEPLLRVDGPSHATLRQFSVYGGGLGNGIVIDNCDQQGARVFMEKADFGSSAVFLLVDRLDNADVSMHDFFHGGASALDVRVIGGATEAAGLPTSGRVDAFGGGTGVSELTYQVEHGGRLLVEDTWYEGHEKTNFMKLTDSGTFTLNSAQIAVGDALQDAGGYPAIQLDDFHGQASFLNAYFTHSKALVTGDGSATDLLLLGCFGYHVSDIPWVINESPNATVKNFLAQSQVPAFIHADPDTGPADPVFLHKMLAQVRTETARQLVPLPPDVSDVRIFRVNVSSCRLGMRLTGTNAPPQLAATPDQFVDEGSTLTLTNFPTDADLPYQTLTYSLTPGAPYGASVNPTNGVFTWMPREEQGPGTNLIQVVVTDDGAPPLSATNRFTVIVQEVNRPPQFGYPNPATVLESGDIGTTDDPLEPGSSVFNPDGSLVAQAGGSGLAADDHFHFTYQKIAGDFDIRVQVSSLEPRDQFSFAGLMAREGLDATSRFMLIEVRPVGPTLDGWYSGQGGNAYTAVRREATGGGVTAWSGDYMGVPYPNAWLRLKRQGNTFSAFKGTNGMDWIIYSAPTVLPSCLNELFVGLATCSSDNVSGQTTHSTYLNYGPFPPPPPSPLKDWIINEGDTLNFRVPAYDLDLPFQNLTFGLAPGSPLGTTIDPMTGDFTWTPSEAQGPSTNIIALIVTDDGVPPLSATNTFTVGVNEVNVAPVLGALNDYTVNPGQTVSFTATATDADWPTNTLSFSLIAPPVGASLDSSSGLFNWRPIVSQANTTNTVQLQVTDYNPYAVNSQHLTDTKSFKVVVNPLAPVFLTPMVYADGQFTFQVSGTAGLDYIILASTNLSVWSDIFTNLSPSTPFQFTNAVTATNRFFRVRLNP